MDSKARGKNSDRPQRHRAGEAISTEPVDMSGSNDTSFSVIEPTPKDSENEASRAPRQASCASSRSPKPRRSGRGRQDRRRSGWRCLFFLPDLAEFFKFLNHVWKGLSSIFAFSKASIFVAKTVCFFFSTIGTK